MIKMISGCVGQQIPMAYKQLESYRGTLVYQSRTYPALVPHFKGIHLTLDSWMPNRDSEGWKIPHPLEAVFFESPYQGEGGGVRPALLSMLVLWVN